MPEAAAEDRRHLPVRLQRKAERIAGERTIEVTVLVAGEDEITAAVAVQAQQLALHVATEVDRADDPGRQPQHDQPWPPGCIGDRQQAVVGSVQIALGASGAALHHQPALVIVDARRDALAVDQQRLQIAGGVVPEHALTLGTRHDLDAADRVGVRAPVVGVGAGRIRRVVAVVPGAIAVCRFEQPPLRIVGVAAAALARQTEGLHRARGSLPRASRRHGPHAAPAAARTRGRARCRIERRSPTPSMRAAANRHCRGAPPRARSTRQTKGGRDRPRRSRCAAAIPETRSRPGARWHRSRTPASVRLRRGAGRGRPDARYRHTQTPCARGRTARLRRGRRPSDRRRGPRAPRRIRTRRPLGVVVVAAFAVGALDDRPAGRRVVRNTEPMTAGCDRPAIRRPSSP